MRTQIKDSQALLGDAIQDFGELSLQAVAALQREVKELRVELAASLLREHDAIEEATSLRLQLERERRAGD